MSSISKPMIILIISLYTNTVAFMEESEWLNKTCPLFPWRAVTHAMEEAMAQTTVFFLNETAGMPMSMLTEQNSELDEPMTKISLFDCVQFVTGSELSIKTAEFLHDLKNKCTRMSCTFLVLCNSTITNNIAETIIKYNLFRPWTFWISSDNTILNFLQKKNIGGTGVPIALPVQNSSNCSQEMIAYSKSNNRIQELATFTDQKRNKSRQHLFLAGNAGTPDSFRILNLLNDTINVGIKELPPYLDFDYVNNGNMTVKRYKGMCIKILETFAKIMNFSYKLVPFSAIGSKTTVEGKSEWNGLIKAVVNKEIDLALGALTITEDRGSVVDFTTHFLEDSSSILSHKPQTVSRVLIFFQVFPWQIWVLLFLSVLIVGPILAILENIIQKTSFVGSLQNLNIWTKWWTLGISVIQKGDIAVQSTAARSLVAFWLFFLVILIGTYTGLLLAFVSFPGYKPTTESLQQLTSDESPFPLALHPSATESYIKEGSTAITNEISQRWAKAAREVFPSTPDEALNSLTFPSHVLLSERLTFQYIISKQLNHCQCCPFYESRLSFLKHYYSFMVPKNSGLLGSFNVILHQLLKNGMINKWLEESLPDISQCKNSISSSNSGSHRPMSLTDMQGAFYILAIGQSLAVFALIIEIGYQNNKSKVRFNIKRRK